MKKLCIIPLMYGSLTCCMDSDNFYTTCFTKEEKEQQLLTAVSQLQISRKKNKVTVDNQEQLAATYNELANLYPSDDPNYHYYNDESLKATNKASQLRIAIRKSKQIELKKQIAELRGLKLDEFTLAKKIHEPLKELISILDEESPDYNTCKSELTDIQKMLISQQEQKQSAQKAAHSTWQAVNRKVRPRSCTQSPAYKAINESIEKAREQLEQRNKELEKERENKKLERRNLELRLLLAADITYETQYKKWDAISSLQKQIVLLCDKDDATYPQLCHSYKTYLYLKAAATKDKEEKKKIDEEARQY